MNESLEDLCAKFGTICFLLFWHMKLPVMLFLEIYHPMSMLYMIQAIPNKLTF